MCVARGRTGPGLGERATATPGPGRLVRVGPGWDGLGTGQGRGRRRRGLVGGLPWASVPHPPAPARVTWGRPPAAAKNGRVGCSRTLGPGPLLSPLDRWQRTVGGGSALGLHSNPKASYPSPTTHRPGRALRPDSRLRPLPVSKYPCRRRVSDDPDGLGLGVNDGEAGREGPTRDSAESPGWVRVVGSWTGPGPRRTWDHYNRPMCRRLGTRKRHEVHQPRDKSEVSPAPR